LATRAIKRLDQLATPCLIVEEEPLRANLQTMAAALPGLKCRPHVKAHKSTILAGMQVAAGHRALTCATPREALGIAAAGLSDDVLLANETVDPIRLAALASTKARITIAIDSDETVRAAARAGLTDVVIDVDVGLHRCGCRPEEAARLSELAQRGGLNVRGVMGYEGHAVGLTDRGERERLTREAMELLIGAHSEVGGEIITAGATGTYDCNFWATELQTGSYLLMDTAYARLGLPFRQALKVLATVISVSRSWAVADCGLKALGMDHGLPAIHEAAVWRCADEHVIFRPSGTVAVGEKVQVLPAHVDPTVAYHDAFWIVNGEDVIDRVAIDLRGW